MRTPKPPEMFNIHPLFPPQIKKKRLLTGSDKKRIAAKQKWKCKICKKSLPTRYHIDHINQFSRGGSDNEQNLQALCPNCHADKTEEERNLERQKKIKKTERKRTNPRLPNFFSWPRL